MSSIPQQMEPKQNGQNESYFVGNQIKWFDVSVILYNLILVT